MTFSKHVKHHPVEFFSILSLLESDPTRQIRMECGSLRGAQARRAQLYAFRKAVENDNDLLQMYPAAPCMMAVLEGEGTLVVLHRDYSPAAEIVRKALAESNKESKDE